MASRAPAQPGSSAKLVFRDAVVASAVAAIAALVINTARGDGIALVQREAYEILVPCPDSTGETSPIGATDPLVSDKNSFLVDARTSAEFADWHAPGAVNIVFDYLDPVAEADIKRVAQSGAQRVVVYGDGDDPDTGQELAKLISARGIRSVLFVQGGAPALRGEVSP